MSSESCSNCVPRTDQTLCYVRGNTFAWTFEWVESDGVTPIDLTNYEALLQVRERSDSQILIFQVTDGQGIILGGVLGTIDITFTKEQTSLTTKPVYVYDLRLTSPSGVVTTLVGGDILVEDAVSRD